MKETGIVSALGLEEDVQDGPLPWSPQTLLKTVGDGREVSWGQPPSKRKWEAPPRGGGGARWKGPSQPGPCRVFLP